jgi:hypothetical protein
MPVAGVGLAVSASRCDKALRRGTPVANRTSRASGGVQRSARPTTKAETITRGESHTLLWVGLAVSHFSSSRISNSAMLVNACPDTSDRAINLR